MFVFLINSCTDSKCSLCKKFKPFVTWDFHELCPACRDCSPGHPCQVCRGWSSREWDLIRQRSEERGKAIKKKSKSKSSRASSSRSSSSKSSQPRKSTNAGSASTNIVNEASRTDRDTARPGPTVHTPGNKASEIGGSTARTGLPNLPSNNPSEVLQETTGPITESVLPAADQSHSGCQEQPLVIPTCAVTPSDSQPSAQSQNFPGSGLAPSSIQDQADEANLSFSSGLQPDLTRDFEGFSERSRSRHRSKSKKKRKRRRRSSSSSSSSSHHRGKKRSSDYSFPTEALSQLVALLSQSVERMPASGNPDSAHQDPASDTDPDLIQGNPEPFPDSQSEHEPQAPFVDEPRHRDPDYSDNSDDSDDDPILGTAFSRDAFDKAVEVIRNQLGFDPPPPQESSSSSSKRSKLSLNKPSVPSRSVMPVDVECFDRFESQANSRKWRAFPKRQSSDFHISDEDYRAFFASPTIPESCLDKLKASGSVDQRGFFRSQTTKKSFLSLQNIDLAARTGMKFASSLLLFAEVLSKSFRQPGTEEVPRKDTGAVINLLGPVSRLAYDQFAKVAVRASMDRRELVLENIHWPSRDIQRRFMDLPLSGPDLFGGKFEEQLSAEIKRMKDINKAEFSFSKDSRPSRPRTPPRYRQPRPTGFPSRRNQPTSNQQRGRPRNQSSFRGFRGTPSTRYSSRRPPRGSSRTNFRGAGRFQPKP